MRKKKKIAVLAVMVLALTAGISYAHVVPGWDEPYDPGNYYSPTSVSIPDSAPSPFALRELSQGDVYDYTRHIKSILFGDNYQNIYGNLLSKLLNEILDMTGMGQGILAQGSQQVQDILRHGQKVGTADSIPYLKAQGMFRQSDGEEGDFDDEAQLKWAGNVYLNGLNAYKTSDEDLADRLEALNGAAKNVADAQGNIQAAQASAQVSAIFAAEAVRRDELLSNYSAVEAAHSRMQLDQDREDVAAVRSGFSFKVMDRENPSKTDMDIYVAHDAPGFLDF